MTEAPLIVIDASVGVKWLKHEPGQSKALALLEEAVLGRARLAAPMHFAHEMLAVAARIGGPAFVAPVWEDLQKSGVLLLPLTSEVVAESAAQCTALGCSFYDALAPACASLLGARLASADRRAHASYPDVLLIG